MADNLRRLLASGLSVRTGRGEEVILVTEMLFPPEPFHVRCRLADLVRIAFRHCSSDVVFMGTLRGKIVAWDLNEPRAYRTTDALIELFVSAVERGRLSAVSVRPSLAVSRCHPACGCPACRRRGVLRPRHDCQQHIYSRCRWGIFPTAR